MNNCWSGVELLSRGELVSLQEKRLMSLLDYIDKRSSYYRKKFKEYGFSPKDFRSIEDLRMLPLTTKQDLVSDVDEEGSPVFYRHLFVDKPENILRWHKTSGTAGTPVRVPDTLWDWNAYAELSAEALYGMGVRRNDIAIIPFGYGPFIAFWVYIAGLERIGTAFIPSGGLDSHGKIALIKEFKATVLICTPSFAIHLGDVASTMGGSLAEDTKIRLVVVTGEPNLPNTKKIIKQVWDAEKRDRLGCAEAGGIAFECPFCPGYYHIQEGFLLAEVIDVGTGRQVQPGEEGELIVTPFYRRGMPVLRFRTGNVVRLAKETRCNCGRNCLSLEETENGVVIRRSDTLTKVRGVLIDPLAIERTLIEFEQSIGSFQVLLENTHGLDEITVKVECKSLRDMKTSDDLIKSLKEALRRKLMIRVNVETLPLGSLNIDGNKAKRIVDLRKGAGHDETGED